jgi:hypothetical protein
MGNLPAQRGGSQSLTFPRSEPTSIASLGHSFLSAVGALEFGPFFFI